MNVENHRRNFILYILTNSRIYTVAHRHWWKMNHLRKRFKLKWNILYKHFYMEWRTGKKGNMKRSLSLYLLVPLCSKRWACWKLKKNEDDDDSSINNSKKWRTASTSILLSFSASSLCASVCECVCTKANSSEWVQVNNVCLCIVSLSFFVRLLLVMVMLFFFCRIECIRQWKGEEGNKQIALLALEIRWPLWNINKLKLFVS